MLDVIKRKPYSGVLEFIQGHRETFYLRLSKYCTPALITVRPRDTRPQAAWTSQVHVFVLDPETFEMHVFACFLHVFARFGTFFGK